MKFPNLFKSLLCFLVISLTCIAGSQSASAKYSRASTKFTYGGVSVAVTDRSREVGNPYDTYGYTEFTNRTDHSIVVNWKAYGVLKSDHRLVKVDGGNFRLRAGETRKEVYSYSSERYSVRDFEKYVVAIDPQNMQVTNNASTSFTKDGVEVQVVDRHRQQGRGVNSYGYLKINNRNNYKVKVEWEVYGVLSNGRRIKADSGVLMLEAKKSHQEVYQYDNNDDFENYVADIRVTKVEAPASPVPTTPAEQNYDAIYNRVMTHKQQGNLTQQDYTDALTWLEHTFDTKMMSIYQQMCRLEERGDEAGIDRLVNQNSALLERFSKLGDIIEDAHNAGRLSAENERRLQRLKNKIEAIM